MRLIFHGFGLSCLGGSVFLQFLVFLSILKDSYFRGVEENKLVLVAEIILTVVTAVYLAYLYHRILLRAKLQ